MLTLYIKLGSIKISPGKNLSADRRVPPRPGNLFVYPTPGFECAIKVLPRARIKKILLHPETITLPAGAGLTEFPGRIVRKYSQAIFAFCSMWLLEDVKNDYIYAGTQANWLFYFFSFSLSRFYRAK